MGCSCAGGVRRVAAVNVCSLWVHLCAVSSSRCLLFVAGWVYPHHPWWYPSYLSHQHGVGREEEVLPSSAVPV